MNCASSFAASLSGNATREPFAPHRLGQATQLELLDHDRAHGRSSCRRVNCLVHEAEDCTIFEVIADFSPRVRDRVPTGVPDA